MTLYTGTILLTELLLAAMVFHVIGYTGFSKPQKRWFVTTYLTIMLCALAEWIAIHFDAHGSAVVYPLTAVTVIQFSLTPLIPIFFAGALGMERIAKMAVFLFAVNVFMEIIAAPQGWIFFFDGNGKYFHGEYYVLYEVFYIFSLIFLIISLFIVGRRFRQRDIITIVMVLVILTAAILPLILFHTYTDYIGIAIGASLCYIYYNDLVQQDVKAELLLHQDRVVTMQEHIISGLANLIENRDLETGEHTARTAAYVKSLAEAARNDGVYADMLDDRYISMLYEMSPLHDIGKIVVPDRILRKEGALTEEEFEQMKQHTTAGERIVREILDGITDTDHIRFAAGIARYHHEKWDGSGYPEGLKGEEIPLPARIMAIADVYDALVSKRYYKNAMEVNAAVEEIRKGAEKHFDPELVEVFLRHRVEFLQS